MTFGTPTDIPTLLSAVAAQIVTGGSFPADTVFTSLAADEAHLEFPPADRFATITPTHFPVNEPSFSGGGRNIAGFDGELKVNVFARYAADQELRDGRLLKDKTRGVLAIFLQVFNALQGFTPSASDGSCLLREPMRAEGFDILPRGKYGQNSWVMLSSKWEIKFTQTLTPQS